MQLSPGPRGLRAGSMMQNLLKKLNPLLLLVLLAHPSPADAFIFVTRGNMSEIPITAQGALLSRFRCFFFFSWSDYNQVGGLSEISNGVAGRYSAAIFISGNTYRL